MKKELTIVSIFAVVSALLVCCYLYAEDKNQMNCIFQNDNTSTQVQSEENELWRGQYGVARCGK